MPLRPEFKRVHTLLKINKNPTQSTTVVTIKNSSQCLLKTFNNFLKQSRFLPRSPSPSCPTLALSRLLTCISIFLKIWELNLALLLSGVSSLFCVVSSLILTTGTTVSGTAWKTLPSKCLQTLGACSAPIRTPGLCLFMKLSKQSSSYWTRVSAGGELLSLSSTWLLDSSSLSR